MLSIDGVVGGKRNNRCLETGRHFSIVCYCLDRLETFDKILSVDFFGFCDNFGFSEDGKWSIL